MHIHRKKQPYTKFYQLNGHILQQVTETPYLGLTIRDDLQWQSHINKICSKANSTLGFIRRNLKHCHSKFKETAYIALVRSLLEYSCAVWDPHLEKDIEKLEKVQRNAARFIKNDYTRKSSVTSMMNDMNWKPLHQRRRETRLILFYKIVNNLVAIPPENHITENKRNLRNTHNKQYLHKKVNIEPYKNSFFPRTILDWNSLSKTEVDCQSLGQFKAVLQRNN